MKPVLIYLSRRTFLFEPAALAILFAMLAAGGEA